MDRAEVVMDRTSLKVQKSKGHAKVIHSRKKTWDEVNKEAFDKEAPPKLSKKAKAKQDEDAAVAEFYADEDGDAEMEGSEVAGETAAGAAAVRVQFASLPVEVAGGDEEIL